MCYRLQSETHSHSRLHPSAASTSAPRPSALVPSPLWEGEGTSKALFVIIHTWQRPCIFYFFVHKAAEQAQKGHMYG